MYIYIIIIYIQNHKISIDIIGIDTYIYTKNFKDVKRSPEFGLYPVSNKHVMDRVDPNNPDTRVMKLGVNGRKGETSSFPPCGNHLPIVSYCTIDVHRLEQAFFNVGSTIISHPHHKS